MYIHIYIFIFIYICIYKYGDYIKLYYIQLYKMKYYILYFTFSPGRSSYLCRAGSLVTPVGAGQARCLCYSCKF